MDQMNKVILAIFQIIAYPRSLESRVFRVLKQAYFEHKQESEGQHNDYQEDPGQDVRTSLGHLLKPTQ